MHRLQTRLRAARAKGKLSRVDVAGRASRLPGAPADIDERLLQTFETTIQTPPSRGLELRAFAAALGLPWLEVLGDLGYWPPLAGSDRASREACAAALLEAAVGLAGWQVQRAGNRVILDGVAR